MPSVWEFYFIPQLCLWLQASPALPGSLRELCLLALLVFSSSAPHTEALRQAFRIQVLKPFLHLGFSPSPPPFLPPYVIWLILTPASSLIPSAFSSEKPPPPHSSGWCRSVSKPLLHSEHHLSTLLNTLVLHLPSLSLWPLLPCDVYLITPIIFHLSY